MKRKKNHLKIEFLNFFLMGREKNAPWGRLNGFGCIGKNIVRTVKTLTCLFTNGQDIDLIILLK